MIHVNYNIQMKVVIGAMGKNDQKSWNIKQGTHDRPH